MDNKTKNFLIGGISFLIGAAAGGAGVYFYSKRYFKEQADAEIKEMADYYNNKYADDILAGKEDSNDSKIEEESNEKERADKEAYIEKTSLYNKEGADEFDKTNYTDCFGDPNTGDSSVSTPAKKKGGRKKKKQEIEIVDQEVWDENPASLDTMFLLYYDADGVLTNEDTEQIVEDVELAKFIEDHENEAIDDTFILQDNRDSKNLLLCHVTIAQQAFSEVGLDD